MFLHEAKQILRTYLLLRPYGPENSIKFFLISCCNFSNNYVQVLRSMHSNVQLLYLLLFFAVVVGIAVLLSKGLYYVLVKAQLLVGCGYKDELKYR